MFSDIKMMFDKIIHSFAAVLPKLRIGNPKCPSANEEWLNKAWYIHTMLCDKPRERRMFMEVER